MRKGRNRRILGMTATQVMILGCLALAAIGAIFGSFILISSSTAPGGLAVLPGAGQTAPPQPVGPTVPPGEPGTVPTAALSVPAEGIPPDWQQHTATTIAIWVPPQFQAVENIDVERQERITDYRAKGYEFLAARLESDQFDYRFWFNYPQPDVPPYVPHIILRADVLPTLSLDEYIDQAYGAGLQGFQVADRQEFAIENLQARRILLDASLSGFPIRFAEYVITDEANLWIISCGSTLDEFDAWLPVFDRVASSFHLLY